MPAGQQKHKADLQIYERMGAFTYFTQVVAGKTLPQTISWKPEWVNQGDLNYTFYKRVQMTCSL